MSQSTHPGLHIAKMLHAAGVSVTDAAAQLGVTRAALSRVLNCNAAVSPEMALRVEHWTGKPLASKLVAMQAQYDLEQARAAFNC